MGIFLLVSMLAIPRTSFAEDTEMELAKKLSNPVANLISVPSRSVAQNRQASNFDLCRSPLLAGSIHRNTGQRASEPDWC